MKNKTTNNFKGQLPGGVWSAAPTPLTDDMELDFESLERMAEHDQALKIDGYFIAGTNGEGPWMTDKQRRQLLENYVKLVQGRVPLAFQITDNSAARMLDNIAMARDAGADIAVIAPPYFIAHKTPAHILNIYMETIQNSSLPIGIYDRGKNAACVLSPSILKTICSDPKVVMLKDSSADLTRMKTLLAVSRKRSNLVLLNGWEFNCVPYLKAGYNGLLLGGGVFNGLMAHQIIKACQNSDWVKAEKLQERMNRLMYDVYGGKKISCWLAGEKHLLVELGIFNTYRNYPQYPLTETCRKAITRAVQREAEYLLPVAKNQTLS